jgi:AcrR family transcriptional regulator
MADARKKMISSAALLFRERGVEATSFTDVLAHSGAPRGSIYHHFPGGKAQLVEEATRYASDWTARGLTAAVEAGDLPATLDLFVASWRHTLESTDFAAGCPVVAVAVAGNQPAAARDAAAAAFARWEELLAALLRDSGADPERARSQATLIVAAIEGAVILARAQRSVAPLERVGRELRALVA